MAETFSNKLTRAAGIVTTSSGGAVGVTTTLITGVSTAGVSVGYQIDNEHFILGTKVATIGIGTVWADRDSTNTASAATQTVKFLGFTSVFTNGSNKSILIGGTFANNTASQVNVTVSVWDHSTSTESGIAQKIPVPNGSSFVVSDAGKIVLEDTDSIRVYCDVNNGIDATLSILSGVN